MNVVRDNTGNNTMNVHSVSTNRMVDNIYNQGDRYVSGFKRF